MRLPLLLLAAALLLATGGVAAAPPDEAIIALDRYTTEKGRDLATTFGRQLRQIYDRVYHCRPWLDVQKGGLGFTRPVGVPGDDRFLNIWVWVDQQITPEFAALTTERRYSAMFSRHGVDLLRQVSADADISAHPSVHGYSVILTWIKPGGSSKEEIGETLGVYATKASVQDFLARRITPREFVEQASIVAFEGKAKLGRLALEVWDDDFSRTKGC